MGAGLLALGMALGGIADVSGRSRRWLLAAGLAHGFAAWAYPTLALAVLVFARRDRRAVAARGARAARVLRRRARPAVGVALAAFLRRLRASATWPRRGAT